MRKALVVSGPVAIDGKIPTMPLGDPGIRGNGSVWRQLRVGKKAARHEETFMFKNILVPTDGSDLASKAVEQAVLFAKKIGAKITAVTVTEPFPLRLVSVGLTQLEHTAVEYENEAKAYAERLLRTVSSTANSAGVACETLHIEHEHVYQVIIDTAEARACDLIVMASHGRRGVSAVVLGSETVKVLTHSKIPVLVYR
jgi:nucleotide-binding universal stress UspA family protein